MNLNDNNSCLLITASVIPCVTNKITVADPQIRFNQYAQSLIYALRNYPVKSIVFCENSGFDITPFNDLVNNNNPHKINVEFMMQDKYDSCTNRDLHFREMLMISNAFQQSKTLNSATHIIKLTGRHYSPSIPYLVNYLYKNNDIDILCDMVVGLSFANARCFVGTPSFFNDYLISFLDIIDGSKGIWFEHAIARAVNKAIGDGLIWSLPPQPIVIVGQSAVSGKIYNNNILNQLRNQIYHKMKWITYGCGRRKYWTEKLGGPIWTRHQE